MARGSKTKNRTPKKDWRQAFIDELARTGHVVRACKKARISRSRAYEVRSTDMVFSAAWTEAEQIANEAMEGEARRRAVEGVLRPVFQGKTLVGKVREYSDTLLIFLLKAHNPSKYRDNARVVVSGDPTAPVAHKHDHDVTATGSISVTAADVAAARILLGLDVGEASGDVHRDGGSQPLDPGKGSPVQ